MIVFYCVGGDGWEPDYGAIEVLPSIDPACWTFHTPNTYSDCVWLVPGTEED